MSMYNSEDVYHYKLHTLIRQELTQRRLQGYIRKRRYNPRDPKIVYMQTMVVWLGEEAELASQLQHEMEACHD